MGSSQRGQRRSGKKVDWNLGISAAGMTFLASWLKFLSEYNLSGSVSLQVVWGSCVCTPFVIACDTHSLGSWHLKREDVRVGLLPGEVCRMGWAAHAGWPVSGAHHQFSRGGHW